jgi:hypothetical protein
MVLSRNLPETTRKWFEDSCRIFGDGTDVNDCYACFAEVSGRMGTGRLREAPGAEQSLRRGELSPEVGEWSLDECGRVVLLAEAAARLPDERLAELVEGCYFQGETRERQGVVRSLGLLPRSDRWLQIGLDAGRTYVQPLFEALACENSFPAEAFPESSFNHMVLKALFTEVRLLRIVGFFPRVTAELRRMVSDYVDERKAAGRSVPPDVALIIPGTGSSR